MMNIRNGRMYFGDHSAGELVRRFGSPLYVYEYEILMRQYERLQRAFRSSDTSVYYACKANANIELLKIFKALGAGIDAVSPGEVYLALRTGFQPDRIILTGTNLTRNDISYALEHDVLVNIDSLSMLQNHGDIFRGRKVAIRLNPDIQTGGHEYLATGHREAKFGIQYNDLPSLIEYISKNRITIVGLHHHIGSDITDAEPLLQSLDMLLQTSRDIPSVQFIDIGGGFKVRYYDNDTETDIDMVGGRICAEFNSFCKKHNRSLRLILEPGKYLVSEGGSLLTTVQSVKINDIKIIVGTDTGMNHLIRPALYDAYHEIQNASSTSGETITVDVVGNVCESADVLGKNIPLVKPDVGDVLCIKNAGSYGYSMASMYNAHMLPAEVLIEGGSARLIRRRQKFDDLHFLDVQ